VSGDRARADTAGPWLLVASLVALVVVVGALGYWAWRIQANNLEATARSTLTMTADDKVREIRLWLDERLGDARAVTGNPLFTAAIAEQLGDGDSAAFDRGVAPLLRRMQRSHDYRTVALVDPNGTPVWGLPRAPGALDAVTASLVRRTEQTGAPLISNLYLTAEGQPGMAMAAPLFAEPGVRSTYVGAIVFAIDPGASLYRLLHRGFATTSTGETLLVERRGDRVAYLSDPRFGSRKALLFSLPIDSPGLPAAAALKGLPAISEATDYRGVPVWFTGRRIQGASWWIIAKIDAAEVLAPVRTRAWLVGGITVAVVLLGGVAFLLFWRLRTARADAALKASELERRALVRRYDLLAKYADDMIVLFDEARVVIDANERACEVYGYSREELLGLTLGDLLTPEQQDLSDGRWRQIETSGGLTFESRHRRKDGSEFPIEISARVIDIEGVRFVHAISRDITDRKRAEEALRENAERLLRAQNLAHIGDWTWEIASGRVTWSDEVYRIFGVDETFPTTFDTIVPLVHADDRQTLGDVVERLMRDLDATELEFRVVRPNGEVRHVRQTITVERDANGTAVRAFGVHQDITERRADEEQIRLLNAEFEERVEDRTAQLEAANKELEAFSYSVSHDLRSPLRAVDGFSLALLEDYGEALDATGRDYLGRVRAASQRMGLLIDDLLRLSRVSRDSMTPRRIDLSKLARATIADLRAREPERAVEVLIEPHVLCTADRRLLGIALDNLLGNAWKFTAGRPDARIEFGAIDDGSASPVYFVRDNGAGFDADYAGGLFQPFQRLHRSDEYPGTGIGLAIVNRVITRHGGRIWAEGAVGGGATFSFTLRESAVSDR
jgi:PAS domain S-box-containing protein